MQKTVIKFVVGLSPNANSWEKRNHKKYGSLQNTCRQIEYDLKHGVQLDEVLAAIEKIQSNVSFKLLRNDSASMDRLSDIEKHFNAPKPISRLW
jgi:3-dehydroquinate dehydratase